MPKFTDNKTKLMLVTSKGTKHLHSQPTSITTGNAQIRFKQSVKNIGFTSSLSEQQCLIHNICENGMECLHVGG